MVGVVALEIAGEVGLLRSLAVTDYQRGVGIGAKLCALMEAYASLMGLRELYLFTLGAEGFFRKLGYTIVSRDHVPKTIQNTKEFANCCSMNARCMFKEMSQLSEQSPKGSF